MENDIFQLAVDFVRKQTTITAYQLQLALHSPLSPVTIEKAEEILQIMENNKIVSPANEIGVRAVAVKEFLSEPLAENPKLVEKDKTVEEDKPPDNFATEQSFKVKKISTSINDESSEIINICNNAETMIDSINFQGALDLLEPLIKKYPNNKKVVLLFNLAETLFKNSTTEPEEKPALNDDELYNQAKSVESVEVKEEREVLGDREGQPKNPVDILPPPPPSPAKKIDPQEIIRLAGLGQSVEEISQTSTAVDNDWKLEDIGNIILKKIKAELTEEEKDEAVNLYINKNLSVSDIANKLVTSRLNVESALREKGYLVPKPNPQLIDNAKSKIEAGNYDAAIQILEPLNQQFPDNAEVTSLLAQAKALKAKRNADQPKPEPTPEPQPTPSKKSVPTTRDSISPWYYEEIIQALKNEGIAQAGIFQTKVTKNWIIDHLSSEYAECATNIQKWLIKNNIIDGWPFYRFKGLSDYLLLPPAEPEPEPKPAPKPQPKPEPEPGITMPTVSKTGKEGEGISKGKKVITFAAIFLSLIALAVIIFMSLQKSDKDEDEQEKLNGPVTIKVLDGLTKSKGARGAKIFEVVDSQDMPREIGIIKNSTGNFTLPEPVPTTIRISHNNYGMYEGTVPEDGIIYLSPPVASITIISDNPYSYSFRGNHFDITDVSSESQVTEFKLPVNYQIRGEIQIGPSKTSWPRFNFMFNSINDYLTVTIKDTVDSVGHPAVKVDWNFQEFQKDTQTTKVVISTP